MFPEVTAKLKPAVIREKAPVEAVSEEVDIVRPTKDEEKPEEVSEAFDVTAPTKKKKKPKKVEEVSEEVSMVAGVIEGKTIYDAVFF